MSERDNQVIQSAYGVVQPGVDLTQRQPGGRGVAQKLGGLLKASHIRGVADAFQNIARNSVDMCRGNEPDFDDTLRWAKRAAPEQVRALFEYVAASTARYSAAGPAYARTRQEPG